MTTGTRVLTCAECGTVSLGGACTDDNHHFGRDSHIVEDRIVTTGRVCKDGANHVIDANRYCLCGAGRSGYAPDETHAPCGHCVAMTAKQARVRASHDVPVRAA